MRQTDDERREVAEDLRHLATYGHICWCEQLYEEVSDAVMPNYDFHGIDALLERLADLIDPDGDDDDE
jgi:hypothetical protein